MKKTTIGAVIIENKKLLLVKKRACWILPGGALDKGETDIGCLCREIKEELSGTKIDTQLYSYFNEFEGISPHRKDEIYTKVYFIDVAGELGKPSNEINDVKFINDFENYNISAITNKVIEDLKKKNYL